MIFELFLPFPFSLRWKTEDFTSYQVDVDTSTHLSSSYSTKSSWRWIRRGRNITIFVLQSNFLNSHQYTFFFGHFSRRYDFQINYFWHFNHIKWMNVQQTKWIHHWNDDLTLVEAPNAHANIERREEIKTINETFLSNRHQSTANLLPQMNSGFVRITISFICLYFLSVTSNRIQMKFKTMFQHLKYFNNYFRSF